MVSIWAFAQTSWWMDAPDGWSEGLTCPIDYKENKDALNLTWLIKAYQQLNGNGDFFNNFFVKLSGTKKLQQQIENGLSEDEIRKSWQEELKNYKKIRAKYLLYKDF